MVRRAYFEAYIIVIDINYRFNGNISMGVDPIRGI
jgi:hypothetical protein